MGERIGNLSGSKMDDYWTLDLSATYAIRQAAGVELAAYNLLEEEFEVAPNVPGWERIFTGSLKLRF